MSDNEVSIKRLSPVINLLEPMTIKEAQVLKGYLRTLGVSPSASYITKAQLRAFAKAIDPLAYGRGTEVGDEVRRILFTLANPDDEPPAAVRLPLPP